MTHSFLKKALTFIGVAALAVPLALGLNGQKVSADTPATPVKTQNVILTKYAFTNNDKGDTSDKKFLTTAPDSDDNQYKNQDRVAGVTFNVYNVTTQYWTGNFDSQDPQLADKLTKNDTDKIATGTTDANGQFTFENLPIYQKVDNKNKPAIYLFAEDKATAPDYDNPAADFVLSLPVKDDKGGNATNVYVYPKNTSIVHFDLEFTKKDSETGETLKDAQFKIFKKQGDKDFYAQVVGAQDNKVTGFSDQPVQVKWVDGAADATTFISDGNGKFGFTSFAESVRDGATYGLTTKGNYTYTETQAPNGYDKAADGTIATQNGKGDASLDVNDAPKGVLPHTGGAGIVLYVVVGAALVVLGTVAYKKRRAN